MEELIFFAVIIGISILESVARSRKAKQGQGAEDGFPMPDGDDQPDWDVEFRDSLEELPTYDQDMSYDEAATGSADQPATGRSVGRYEARVPSSGGSRRRNLFQELAEIASQLEGEQAAARTVDIPKQSPPLPDPDPDIKPAREPSRRFRGPARTHGEHRVHRAHAGYGTDPSERAPSEQDGMDPLARSLSEDASAIRRQLLSRRGAELRQAIMLREVLGPPVTLRDEEV